MHRCELFMITASCRKLKTKKNQKAWERFKWCPLAMTQLLDSSRNRGVIPKQSIFERLLFKTRELEQNSALQLNELKKFHEKWRDLKFAEPRPRQSRTIREYGCMRIFPTLSETTLLFFLHLISFCQLFTFVCSMALNSTSCNTYCKLL